MTPFAHHPFLVARAPGTLAFWSNEPVTLLDFIGRMDRQRISLSGRIRLWRHFLGAVFRQYDVTLAGRTVIIDGEKYIVCGQSNEVGLTIVEVA